jgi:hypothetical protein
MTAHIEIPAKLRGVMKPIAPRLEAMSVRIPISGCHLFIGGSVPFGYGVISFNGRQQYAHRVSWEVESGPVPKGMRVLHRCDVPACINPHHLFLGTDQDNITDKMGKGRWRGGPPTGERNPMRAHKGLLAGAKHGMAKLSASDVQAIRAEYAAGIKQTELAARYAVRQGHISKIVRGESWA